MRNMLKPLWAAAGAALVVAACTPATPPVKPSETAMSPPAAAAPAQPATPPARIGKWGVDLSYRDPSVKAGDDFYRFAIGHWLDSNEIPADRTSWSTFAVLADEAERQLRGLVEALPDDSPTG